MQASAPKRIGLPLLVAALQLLAPTARADEPSAHRLGDHPAVVVQRLLKSAGYDYASKFYPHPAGLYLYAEAPPADEAAVAAAKAKQKETAGPEAAPQATLTAEVRRMRGL